jgi:hypothetical protein
MKRGYTKARELKLLPYSVRENLPILGSQQHLRGRMRVLATCATADGSATWHIIEGSARRNTDGEVVDYLLYGLVEDQGRKLDYFWLSDLAAFHSPKGLPLVPDRHWKPKTLEEIAPELFRTQKENTMR